MKSAKNYPAIKPTQPIIKKTISSPKSEIQNKQRDSILETENLILKEQIEQLKNVIVSMCVTRESVNSRTAVKPILSQTLTTPKVSYSPSSSQRAPVRQPRYGLELSKPKREFATLKCNNQTQRLPQQLTQTPNSCSRVRQPVKISVKRQQTTLSPRQLNFSCQTSPKVITPTIKLRPNNNYRGDIYQNAIRRISSRISNSGSKATVRLQSENGSSQQSAFKTIEKLSKTQFTATKIQQKSIPATMSDHQSQAVLTLGKSISFAELNNLNSRYTINESAKYFKSAATPSSQSQYSERNSIAMPQTSQESNRKSSVQWLEYQSVQSSKLEQLCVPTLQSPRRKRAVDDSSPSTKLLELSNGTSQRIMTGLRVSPGRNSKVQECSAIMLKAQYSVHDTVCTTDRNSEEIDCIFKPTQITISHQSQPSKVENKKQKRKSTEENQSSSLLKRKPQKQEISVIQEARQSSKSPSVARPKLQCISNQSRLLQLTSCFKLRAEQRQRDQEQTIFKSLRSPKSFNETQRLVKKDKLKEIRPLQGKMERKNGTLLVQGSNQDLHSVSRSMMQTQVIDLKNMQRQERTGSRLTQSMKWQR